GLNPPGIPSGRFAESPPHDYQRRRGHNCILLETGVREDLFAAAGCGLARLLDRRPYDTANLGPMPRVSVETYRATDVSSCSATNARRNTFPAIVFGKLFRNSICAGTLNGAIFERQKARSSSAVTVERGRRTTHALTASPLIWSEIPATPTSRTAGCKASASSISRGHTWYPLVLI